jgi:hypothetical protein
MASLAACAGDNPTELVLVVDTDSAASVIDTLSIVVRGPSGAERDVTVTYDGAPRTLGLTAATDVLGPVEITVSGSSSTAPAGLPAVRLVRTRFIKGVSRMLHIRVSADCLGRTCATGETCDSVGACVAPDVDANALPAYDGKVSVPELCNGADDDGDGRADEDFNLATNPHHCGACNHPCVPGGLCVDSICEDSPIVQLTAGAYHTCALRESGGVACWGDNQYGELGDGTHANRSRPVSVPGISDAISLSAGYGFTCAVRRDASVACWGSNSCGEQGRVGEGTSVPTQVPGVNGAVEVSGGNCHNCARLSSGSVYCWGEDTYGQIGNGVMYGDPPALPTLVMDMANATSVRVGFDHSCALRTNGSVSCWGNNTTRQLGDGTEISRAVPTSVIGLPDLTDATMRGVAIGAGVDFSCVLTSSGARCWGANGSAQLGLAATTSWDGLAPTVVAGTAGATMLSIGSRGCFGCVLGAGGVVSCWGCNAEGQLANASTTPTPTAAPISGVPAASALAVGGTHACVLAADGTVWCWGGNASGQLGIGSGLPSSPPAQVTDL